MFPVNPRRVSFQAHRIKVTTDPSLTLRVSETDQS